MDDLDNYAFPLAKRLYSHDLVSVWASKRHAPASYITAAPARKASPPAELWPARTSSSADGVAYKEQVRAALASAAELPAGPVSLQIAFAVGPRRNWLNLWKPTIDALDPLLGRATLDRLWHPNDGRVIDLGLHVTTNRDLGNDVQLFIAAWAATTS